jgi:hypothetical protein
MEKRGVYRVLVRTSERKRPLGKLRRRWEDNNRLDIKKRIEVMYWIDLAWDPDKWLALLKLGNEHSLSRKCEEFIDLLRNS